MNETLSIIDVAQDSKPELSVLDSLFRELASRSAGPTMDKATFLRIYNVVCRSSYKF